MGIVALPCNAIPLVPDEHDDHVAVAVLPGVLQPGGQVIEGVPPGDVIYKERSSGPPVVGAGNRSERLLSRLKNTFFDQIKGEYVTITTRSCDRYHQ